MADKKQIQAYLTIKHQELTWAINNNLTTLARVLLDNIVRTEKLLKDYKPENELELWN